MPQQVRCKACKKILNAEEMEDALATGEIFCNKCIFSKSPEELLELEQDAKEKRFKNMSNLL